MALGYSPGGVTSSQIERSSSQSSEFLLESLILAQDERWRRA